MKGIEVSFFGLCAFIERTNAYDVYLLDGKHLPVPKCDVEEAPHVATLTIPTKQFETDSSWKPDLIVLHPQAELACWRLAPGIKLEFGPQRIAPTWSEKDNTVRFDQEHPGVAVESQDRLRARSCSVIVLGEGKIAAGSKKTKLNVKKAGKKEERLLSRTVNWTSAQGPMTISNLAISKEIEVHADAMVSVTNVSTTPAHRSSGQPIPHFGLYYRLFKDNNIKCDARVELSLPDRKTNGDPFREVEVYDCVPPTGGS